ncbi:MAG: AAA family ATPase [Patescibacteria group bacterium]|nr:AAA family ATPase [Patescibacteria group bacterium]
MAGQVPFLPPDFASAERMILVEGESDTMALWQALPDELRGKVSVVGLSGTGSWKSRYADELFKDAKRVFVVFDRDDPYTNPDGAASVDRAWQTIRSDLGRKARRVVLPQGINDVAEFFQRYDWAAFQVLLRKASQPVRHYPRLDLTRPVPETDWLVEDMLVRNEASVLAADGGVGKSWITMALALAVAGGDDRFLGLPVKRSGRVLYVDEENSASLVLQRLSALGMESRHRDNLDYIWYGGVDLLNEPEKLLEEAAELEPELVIIDSLSRVTIGAEENSNTDMTRLMKSGVVPIARETGAAVLLTHHTDKNGLGMRGATSIRNAADQVISMVPALSNGKPTGSLNIFPSKPRRRTRTIQARIEGDMEIDGRVRVEGVPEEDQPF